MAYRVRNADGEVRFDDLASLKAAYREGLVEPSDEVSAGESPWRRAEAMPELRGIREQRPSQRVEVRRWYGMAAGLGAVALFLLLFRPVFWVWVLVALVGVNLLIWFEVKRARGRRRK